jgi:Tol biopolymer transport system component
MNRLVYIMLCLLFLTSCFRQTPAPTVPPDEEAAVFSDALLDGAAKVESSVVGLEGTVDDSQAVNLDEDVGATSAPELSAQAVVPGATGFVVWAGQFPAINPWRVIRQDQAADQLTVVYAGARQVDSVAVSGDGNTVLASVKETTDPASDFEIYQFTVTPPLVVQLTNNAGADTNVSMSADGSKYVWEGDGATAGVRNIFLRNNTPTPATTVLDPSITSTQPSITNNGKFIALTRIAAGVTTNYRYDVTTNVYSALGSSVQTMLHPSLSNDGLKNAVLLANGTTRYRLFVRDLRLPTAGLALINTTTPLNHPNLTGDGNYLTYAAQEQGVFVIVTRNLTTNVEVRQVNASANLSAPYWQQPGPPPPPAPNARDIQVNGGAAPMVFGGGSFTFDASIFGGSNYQWSFGDGSSATGEFVEKEYTNPGKYTVSLSFTDAYGRPATLTTEVAKYKEIHDLPSTRAASGDNKIVFDVEFPLDGFIYEWDAGDGQTPVRQPRLEKDYTNSTAPGSTSPLGFYEVTLKVYDNRNNAQTALSGIQTAAVEPVLAETQNTRVNIYHAKPVAKFTAQHSQSTEGIAIAGYGPLTVNFDGSGSTTDVGNQLTYAWSFGDGTTSAQAITSKTFETPGRFLVTLKVKDKYQQEDISQTFVYVLTNRQKILSGFRYPQLTANLQASSLQTSSLQTGKSIDVLAEAQAWEAEALKAGERAVEDTPMPAQGEITAQATAFFDDFYPVVTHTSGSILNAIFYPLSGSFVTQGVLTYVNGVQVFPNVTPGVIAADNPVNPGQLWNSILFTSAAVPKPVRDGLNSVQVINSSQLFDLKYSGFTGLRVPRVSIAILPDEQMPGDMASPMLTETTVQLNGKKEMLLQVNIRESEAQAFAEFEVPVYAVNAQGSNLTNLDGLFRAKFDNLVDSEVSDGIMVQGKAFIKVKLPLNVYGNGQPIDLTRIRVYANTPSCDGVALYKLPNPVAGGTPANTTKSISGCTFVTATFEAPTNTALPAYAYTLPAEFDTTTNKIKLGTASTEIYDNNLKDVPGNVARFVIGFIPIIGDSVDLIEQAFNAAVGDDVDPVLTGFAMVGLALDLGTGGVGDLTSIFKGSYRLSLQLAEQGVGGVLASFMRSQMENLITGTSTVRQLFDILKERLKGLADLAKAGSGCGLFGARCWGNYDNVAKIVKGTDGLDDVAALGKLDDTLDDIGAAGIDTSCFLNFSTSAVRSYGLRDVSMIFFGVAISSASNIVFEPMAGPGNKRCGTETLRGRGKSVYSGTFYKNIPDDELKKLAPHHIVPLNEFADAFCLNSLGRNVCNDARKLLEQAGIELNDGFNAALIPWGHTAASDLTEFLKLYPNALKHTTRGGIHTLKFYEDVLNALKISSGTLIDSTTLVLKDPTKKQDLKNALTLKLEDIVRNYLNGKTATGANP